MKRRSSRAAKPKPKPVCKKHRAVKFLTKRGWWECTQCNTDCHRRMRERKRRENGFDRRVRTRERPRVETDIPCKKHKVMKRRGVDGSLKCNVCEREYIAKQKQQTKIDREDEPRWNRIFAKLADPHYYDECKLQRQAQWRKALSKGGDA